MPESKGRARPKSRPPVDPAKESMPKTSPRWLVPAMLACFLLGLLWIVLYYLAPSMPVMSELGNWSMLIGFGLIIAGFVLSTRWR